MNIFNKKVAKGFSLIELMVVISIIIILLGIVMASIMEARKKSRDERRVSDVANIALAMTLYKEKNRDYPSYPSGIELGKGGALDAEIRQFNGNVYNDPLSDVGNYGYWYYSNFLCNGERVNVVLAKTVERSGTSNFEELCNGGAVLPYETGLIPRAHAAFWNNNQYSQSAYAPCAVSVSPTTVTLNSSGSIVGALNISWSNNTVQRSVGLYRPDGSYMHQWDNTYSGVPLQHPPTGLSAGTYSVSASGCTAAPLQVNPYVPPVAPTQCNDGVDNADTEDTLIDAADPGCHTNDDLSQPYVSTINSEANTVAPPLQSDTAFVGSYIIILE